MLTSPRPLVWLARRGRRWTVPLTSAPVAPAASIPKAITALRRRPQLLVRRGSFIEPAWPAIPAAPYTPITDPVSSVRPNPAAAGIRGNAAAAAARPNPAEATT